MLRNPLFNALSAGAYITAVASLMFYGPRWVEPEDSVIMPISMLSLFVLSAAVMGYIFFLKAIKLYADGEKEYAVHFFLATLGYFALFTFFAFFILFLTK